MARLALQDGRLVLQPGSHRRLLDWRSRLYLTVAVGLHFDSERACYVLLKRERLSDVLRETALYLRDSGIAFDADGSVAGMIQALAAEQARYEEAVIQGAAALSSDAEVDLPPTLVRQLTPHQQRALAHLLAVQHGADFSVPGSGKTTVVYAAFETMRLAGAVDKILVVGPRSCFFPWEEEFRSCFGVHARSVRLTGTKSSRQVLYMGSDKHDVLLCTYQTAANDVEELIDLCKRHRIFLVIDESHNIKRLEGGVWSEAMLRVAPYAAHRAVLSGTPMPNSFSDLWSQFTFLWPGRQVFGDRVSYQNRCQEQSGLQWIRETIKPLFFRTRKSQLGLPSARVERVRCSLKPYQDSIYRALSARFLREVRTPPEDRRALRGWRRARMVRLIQAASNPALLARYSEEFDVQPIGLGTPSILQMIEKYPRYEIPAKVEKTAELVRGLTRDGQKVLVWTCFVHNIRMLQSLLKEDLLVFTVYGAVPRDESEDVEFNREQQLLHFKECHQPAVLLANPAACAESVSLHKVCHDAVYLDRTFNCGQYMQSLDRIHRIGLSPNETVTYHVLIAADTIDETIERRLEDKRRAMMHLLEDELPIGSLDVEDHQLGRSDDEEAIDFEQTIRDVSSYA